MLLGFFLPFCFKRGTQTCVNRGNSNVKLNIPQESFIYPTCLCLKYYPSHLDRPKWLNSVKIINNYNLTLSLIKTTLCYLSTDLESQTFKQTDVMS